MTKLNEENKLRTKQSLRVFFTQIGIPLVMVTKTLVIIVYYVKCFKQK